MSQMCPVVLYIEVLQGSVIANTHIVCQVWSEPDKLLCVSVVVYASGPVMGQHDVYMP